MLFSIFTISVSVIGSLYMADYSMRKTDNKLFQFSLSILTGLTIYFIIKNFESLINFIYWV